MKPIPMLKFTGSVKQAHAFFEIPLDTKNKGDHTKANTNHIATDITRAWFVGDVERKEFEDYWTSAGEKENYVYTQGDMTGGSVTMLNYRKYYIPNVLLKDPRFQESFRNYCPEEADETAQLSRRDIRFGYKDDKGNIRGICIVYNVLNPKHWMISIMGNATKTFSQRTLFIFSTIPFPSKKATLRLSRKPFSDANLNELLKCIDSSSISAIIGELISCRNLLNVDFAHTLHNMHNTKDPSACTSPKSILTKFQNRKVVHYQSLKRRWGNRLPILQKWLLSRGIEEKMQVPILLPASEVSIEKTSPQIGSLTDYLREELQNTSASPRRLLLIPLKLSPKGMEDHWTLLMVYIHGGNRINSVAHIDPLMTRELMVEVLTRKTNRTRESFAELSINQLQIAITNANRTYPGDVVLRPLEEQHIITQQVRAADKTFMRKISRHCFLLHSNPHTTHILTIENAVKMVGKLYFGMHHIVGTTICDESMVEVFKNQTGLSIFAPQTNENPLVTASPHENGHWQSRRSFG